MYVLYAHRRFRCVNVNMVGVGSASTFSPLARVPPADNDDVIGRDLHEAKWRGVEDAGGCEAAYPVCPASVFEMLDSANLL